MYCSTLRAEIQELAARGEKEHEFRERVAARSMRNMNDTDEVNKARKQAADGAAESYAASHKQVRK